MVKKRERDEDERSGRYQTIKNEGKKSFHFRNLFFVLMLLLVLIVVFPQIVTGLPKMMQG